MLITIEKCPVCVGDILHPYMACKDFTTTGEIFQLVKCSSCSLILTSPRPDDESLGGYYESENYISHTGKSFAMFGGLYLLARRFTLKWKFNIVAQAQTGKDILDYGCGTGEFLELCSNQGWSGYGVEPSDSAHTTASAKPNIHIAKDLSSFAGRKFDAITLWHVLEHVSDLQDKLLALKSHLQKNGTLFVAVPNHTSYDAKFYKNFWAAYDVPRHLWHFNKETMNLLIKNAGLTLTEIVPMKLDAYYVSLLSEKYKIGSSTVSGMIQAFIVAFKSNRKAKKEMDYSSLIYIIK